MTSLEKDIDTLNIILSKENKNTDATIEALKKAQDILTTRFKGILFRDFTGDAGSTITNQVNEILNKVSSAKSDKDKQKIVDDSLKTIRDNKYVKSFKQHFGNILGYKHIYGYTGGSYKARYLSIKKKN